MLLSVLLWVMWWWCSPAGKATLHLVLWNSSSWWRADELLSWGLWVSFFHETMRLPLAARVNPSPPGSCTGNALGFFSLFLIGHTLLTKSDPRSETPAVLPQDLMSSGRQINCSWLAASVIHLEAGSRRAHWGDSITSSFLVFLVDQQIQAGQRGPGSCFGLFQSGFDQSSTSWRAETPMLTKMRSGERGGCLGKRPLVGILWFTVIFLILNTINVILEAAFANCGWVCRRARARARV